jgi:hypothetical protein
MFATLGDMLYQGHIIMLIVIVVAVRTAMKNPSGAKTVAGGAFSLFKRLIK